MENWKESGFEARNVKLQAPRYTHLYPCGHAIKRDC